MTIWGVIKIVCTQIWVVAAKSLWLHRVGKPPPLTRTILEISQCPQAGLKSRFVSLAPQFNVKSMSPSGISRAKLQSASLLYRSSGVVDSRICQRCGAVDRIENYSWNVTVPYNSIAASRVRIRASAYIRLLFFIKYHSEECRFEWRLENIFAKVTTIRGTWKLRVFNRWKLHSEQDTNAWRDLLRRE